MVSWGAVFVLVAAGSVITAPVLMANAAVVLPMMAAGVLLIGAHAR